MKKIIIEDKRRTSFVNLKHRCTNQGYTRLSTNQISQFDTKKYKLFVKREDKNIVLQ